MAIVKKTSQVQAAPAGEAGLAFGDLSIVVSGGGIPESKYALEFQVQYEPVTERYTPKVPRVGLMVIAHPLNGGDLKTKFLSMGTTMHESWAPNPDTGKGLVPVPDGPGAQTISDQSNYGIFLASLYQAGLPKGVFVNDVSVLDGVWVQTVNVPETDERKSFRSKAASSEVEQTVKQGNSTTLTVSEILEGGAPWEGGGGIPEAKATPPAKANGKAPVVAAGKPNGKAVAKATPPPAPTGDISEGDLMEAAMQSATAVLEKNPDGVARLLLRTGTFKAATASFGDEIASSIISTFFANDASLSSVVEQLGYIVQGQKVVPAPEPTA